MEIISPCTVVHGYDECVLNCYDETQFFLYAITVLKRLIMLKLMNYWNSFCTINQDVMNKIGSVIGNIFMYDRDSDIPRAINDKDIRSFS